MSDGECRIYVGSMPSDITTRKISDIFSRFGKILSVVLKRRHNTISSFAFLQFEDPRDAEDAVNEGNGYNYEGYRLKVEFPIGEKLPLRRTQNELEERKSGGDEQLRGPPREYRAFVSGLPLSGSWQDLKDHMRPAGEISFADTYRDGTGVVYYLHPNDMKYAVKALDDTKFRSHKGEISYIRVKGDFSRSPSSDSSSSRSHTPSRRRSGSSRRNSSRSRSRSPFWRRSYSSRRNSSRSRSRSPSWRRSYYPKRNSSRSRSRSPSRRRSYYPKRNSSKSRSRSPSYGRLRR